MKTEQLMKPFPMCVSTLNWRGFSPYDFKRPIEVLLDGAVVLDVVAFDQEAGLVYVMMRDAEGHYLVNSNRTRIRVEVLEGVVTVRSPQGERP